VAFRKGQSGNPAGRPKGIQDKRVNLRKLLEPHAEALVEKAVALALEGDTTALRLCLERLVPAYRAQEMPADEDESWTAKEAPLLDTKGVLERYRARVAAGEC
jgi:Family of unknown function (DUF5681)